ncbi:hypothetical protein [Amycolatopsis sp. CB00013]|uniref:hypothetical protein n=1 Tax=Amycolatopsis sp. CB00013 TaxID=1703945 RepID=UPI001160FEB6|nr:hypothetical protein [Amycolatopsis sp. CB00013]
MSYTGRELIYGALYMNSCRTANIERFIDHLTEYQDLDETVLPREFEEFAQRLASIVDVDKLIATDTDAQRRLIATDLRLLASEGFSERNLPESVEHGLTSSEKTVRDRFEQLGLHPVASKLNIVERFPEPFDKFDWAAFAPDREDEQEFGIPQGIYFKRSRLRPLYSQALYAHEVIHTITGQVDPHVYVGGLEEGIAEVIGTCYGGLAMMPPKVLKNMLVYGRHGVERPKIWSLYRDHTRQAMLLYCEFGLTGLSTLVTRGREAIHAAAATVLDGSYKKLDLPRGKFDSDTLSILEFACLGFIPSYAYSPIDCLLALHVRSGMTVTEVSHAASIDPSIAKERISSIASESALFVLNGSKVGYSNVERLLSAENQASVSILRYVPGKS